jgi:hypothetical protein
MIQPPDYILVTPQDDEVPEMVASSEDIDDLKEIKQKGMYIYKLVGRKS